jgi:hypothetical protein
MLKNFIAPTLLFLLIVSCNNDPKPKEVTANGVWKSVGSDWILQIKDSTTFHFYDITNISCLPNAEGEFSTLEKSLVIQNDTLHLQKGVITYQFTSIANLPELCTSIMDEAKRNNPLYNFEVFAETVKENYAYFALNGIDWELVYTQQKNKLTEQSTDVELYQVIDETLEKLHDNHGFLEASDDVHEALDTLTVSTTATDELPEYGDFQVAQMVAKHHLEEEMTKDSWLIQWGKLSNNIGYMQVKSMWLYADLNIPKQRIEELGYVDAYVETFHNMYEGDYIEKEVEGVSKIMKNVQKDLSNMDAIVIDVRFNGGGQDAVSFEILRHFISQKQLKIATQKLRFGEQHTPVLPLYINGSANAFTKPIYVLTSQQTGSAAEAFSIATMAIDHVQRIGSETAGAMSTALEKTLPNGWHFAISNEIYMDTQGNCYENIGIPVDYHISYPKDRQTFFRSVVDDLEADKKNILLTIEHLRKK